MTIKVVSVREADGGGAVILSFEISADGDGRSERRSLLLTLPQYRELRLRRGDTLSPEEFDELEAMSETAAATRRGAGILAYGANSRRTLQRKLMTKGFSREAADAAVTALSDDGLIDEKKPHCARRSGAPRRCAAENIFPRGFFRSDTAEKPPTTPTNILIRSISPHFAQIISKRNTAARSRTSRASATAQSPRSCAVALPAPIYARR